VIARLEGRLAEKHPERVILDVGGVGYEVRVPLSTFLELPDEGKTVRLRVHTYVREDALHLYGFVSEAERVAFATLLGINGVGPRLALAILSGVPVARLAHAVRRGDVAALRGIPGVGPKTAERIVVELRDKADRLEAVAPAAPGDDAEEAALSALVNLGYARAQAEKATRAARERLGERPALEALIREALRVAAG
jgi:Holliday junction DNA helicase RuvA